MMKKLLWLDDVRNPYLNDELKVPEGYCVEWVLNYTQFVAWINKFGLPDAISFDHDLANEHYTPEYFWHDYEESRKFQEWRQKSYKFETGEGCAKWLIAFCKAEKKNMPKFFIHSANPVGADKIRDVLNGMVV